MGEKTKKFEVRLESQADDQFRIVRLRAKDAAEARAVAEGKEREYVAFRLSDDELDVIGRLHRFADKDEIDPRTGGLYKHGTVLGPDGGARTKLHYHYLSEPYKVVDVSEVEG